MKVDAPRGSNRHIIGAISQRERQGGSFKKIKCCEAFDKMTKLVIVNDNETFQVDLEKVIKEDEFNGATIIHPTEYNKH